MMFKVQTLAKTFLTVGAVAMMAGCGGKPSRMERAMSEKDSIIRRQESQLAQAQQREETLLSQSNKLNAQNEQLARQSSEVLEQNKVMAKNLKYVAEETTKQLMKSQAKVDSLSDQIARLEGKLGAQKGGDVSVSLNKLGTITIRVANTVLFGLGKAELKSSSYAKLNKIAQTLKTDYANNFVRVEGHTDSSPVKKHKHLFADNMVLSQARSKAVYDYLVIKAGMPANKMYTAGYSYFQPVVWPEKTNQDRARNRRVDIVILPNIKVAKESLAANK